MSQLDKRVQIHVLLKALLDESDLVDMNAGTSGKLYLRHEGLHVRPQPLYALGQRLPVVGSDVSPDFLVNLPHVLTH